jgi:hypothetical protein
MNQTKAQQDEYATQLASSNRSSHVDTSKSIMYYINDGVYASFNCLFYDHAEVQPILINQESKSAPLYKTSIWGPTCDGLDLVVKECLLPDLNQGEFIVFKDMGAYTISGAVAFNGIPLPKCIYTISSSWDIIKNAFADLDDEPYVMALFELDSRQENNLNLSSGVEPISCAELSSDSGFGPLTGADIPSCAANTSSVDEEIAKQQASDLETVLNNLDGVTSCADEVEAINLSVNQTSVADFAITC